MTTASSSVIELGISSANLEHAFQEVLITVPIVQIQHVIIHIWSSLQHAQTNIEQVQRVLLISPHKNAPLVAFHTS